MPTPSNYNPELAARLREARADAGLTQTAVAKALGISRASVSQWEKTGPDSSAPTMENLVKVAKIYGRPLNWFLIEDAGAAMRAASSTMRDDLSNAILSLPDPMQEVIERQVRRVTQYVQTLPPWMTSMQPPKDAAERQRWISMIERDIEERLPRLDPDAK